MSPTRIGVVGSRAAVMADKPQNFNDAKRAKQGIYYCYYDCGKYFRSEKEAKKHEACPRRKEEDKKFAKNCEIHGWSNPPTMINSYPNSLAASASPTMNQKELAKFLESLPVLTLKEKFKRFVDASKTFEEEKEIRRDEFSTKLKKFPVLCKLEQWEISYKALRKSVDKLKIESRKRCAEKEQKALLGNAVHNNNDEEGRGPE